MATKPLGFHKSSLGKRGHGSPRKAWSECAREDLDAFKLKPSDAQDRVGLEILCEKTVKWSLPCSVGGTSLSKARSTRGM